MARVQSVGVQAGKDQRRHVHASAASYSPPTRPATRSPAGLRRAGTDVADIHDLYGHTRPETTMIDASPERAKHRAALKRLRRTDGTARRSRPEGQFSRFAGMWLCLLGFEAPTRSARRREKAAVWHSSGLEKKMRDNYITTAVGMFNGTLLLLGEFNKHDEGEEYERATRRSLLLPLCVNCIFGVEMALKSLVMRQGDSPRDTHDLLHLYDRVSSETQEAISTLAASLGVQNVHGMLRAHRNGLQEWRYRQDRDTSVVDLGIVNVLRAIIDIHSSMYGASGSNRDKSEGGAAVGPPASVVDATARHRKMMERGGRRKGRRRGGE